MRPVDAVLLYDGACGMCSFAKRLVVALDLWRRIRTVALQDPESERVLAGMDEDQRWSSFHVALDGRTVGRGDGVIELLGVLPLGGGIPKLAADAPVLRAASERFYSLAHGVRNALQCEV